MSTIKNILMPICLALLLLLYVRAAQRMRYAVCGSDDKTSAGGRSLYLGAAALPVLVMSAVWLPLPIFYLLLYAAGCLHIILTQEKDRREWLFMNVRFLSFTSPHLIAVGVLALCAQTDVAGILGSFAGRTLSLLIVTALNAAVLPALMRRLGGRLHDLNWNSEELHLFSWFVWLCACSVVFDSIPCLFSLPTIFPLLFLIGSNILLLLMAFLFARHVYTIMRDSYLKEESMRLRAEAMVQHSRTVRMEKEACQDVLTGLYTRRYAMSNMADMLRGGEAFAVVFLDLDRLKQINDEQGHLAGDEYLRSFSAHMRERLRPNDIFARYGGDEFLILMPDLDPEDADTKIFHIQSVASAAAPQGWGTPFSYGLAAARPGDGTEPEDWISEADQAMYQNKKSRRMCRKEG